VTLPILTDPNELPLVEGTVNGRPVRLLIDTGTSATIVSATFLGVAPDAGTRLESLCLGALCWRQLAIWAADTLFSRPEADAINGIVGMSPLAQYVVQLDHGRTLTLSATADPCDAPAQPLTLNADGVPLLPASADGQNLGDVLLDTGARYTLLSAAVAAQSAYLAAGALETGACSIDGCTTSGSFVSTLRHFCAGASCLDQVAVKYPAWNAVGGTFLRRVRMVADFPRRTVAFCQDRP
jgi:predicted aspartyl protease